MKYNKRFFELCQIIGIKTIKDLSNFLECFQGKNQSIIDCLEEYIKFKNRRAF